MRVTNDTLRQVFLNALELSQRRIKETQTQISTGLRIAQPSDDPLATVRIRELEASLSRLDQYQTNGVIARNRLSLEEQVIANVVTDLQRVRELVLQANNATQNFESRAAIALEIRQRLDGLLALANSADVSGRFLFSGFAEGTRPFVRSGGTVTYNGDQGQRTVQINAGRFVAVSDAGSEVFLRIANGNGTFALAANAANAGTGVLGAGAVTDPTAYVADTYTVTFLTPSTYEVRDGGGGLVVAGTYAVGDSIAFLGIEIQLTGQPAAGDVFTVTPSTSQDLFATVQSFITSIDVSNDSETGRAMLNNEMGQALVDLDQAIGHFLQVRAQIGGRLNALDEEASLNEGFAVQFTGTLSELRDTDYAEAISTLSQQLLGLEVAQQSFVRVQGLSLFRFL